MRAWQETRPRAPVLAHLFTQRAAAPASGARAPPFAQRVRESDEWNTSTYDVGEGDPSLSAAVHVRVESILGRGNRGRFHIVTLGQMTCDTTTFFVEDEVRVTKGEDGDQRRSLRRGDVTRRRGTSSEARRRRAIVRRSEEE